MFIEFRVKFTPRNLSCRANVIQYKQASFHTVAKFNVFVEHFNKVAITTKLDVVPCTSNFMAHRSAADVIWYFPVRGQLTVGYRISKQLFKILDFRSSKCKIWIISLKEFWVLLATYKITLKRVPIRKPGRRWHSSSHRFRSNLAQILGVVSEWLWQKKIRSKYFIPFTRHLTIIYAFLVSHLWFSMSTTRKDLWNWNLQNIFLGEILVREFCTVIVCIVAVTCMTRAKQNAIHSWDLTITFSGRDI